MASPPRARAAQAVILQCCPSLLAKEALAREARDAFGFAGPGGARETGFGAGGPPGLGKQKRVPRADREGAPASRSSPSGTNPQRALRRLLAQPRVRRCWRGWQAAGGACPIRCARHVPALVLPAAAGLRDLRRRICIRRHDRRLGRVPRAADASLMAELRVIVKNKERTLCCCLRYGRSRHPRTCCGDPRLLTLRFQDGDGRDRP